MEKFTYLRTSLTGEALQEIATIEMSAVNYRIAWEALETMYENKKMLVMTHLDTLFAQESMRQESFESLNRLVSGFEKNLQMLSKLGERTDGWSTLLQYMLSHMAIFCTRGSCHHCGQRLLHASPSTHTNTQPKSGQQLNKKPQWQQTQPPQNLAKSTPNNHSADTQFTQKAHTNPSTSCHTASSVNIHHTSHTVLLSTAIVSLGDQYENSILARALLDYGSQRCYISENLSQKLKFKRSCELLPIVGIGGARTSSTQAVFAEVKSLNTPFKRQLKFHVLSRVTVDLPVRSIAINSWQIPANIVLADPTFNESGAVDLIIGAELYLELMIPEYQAKLDEFGPILQNTQLGWIIAGVVPEVSICNNAVTSESWEVLESQLARFFELESCRTSSTLSLEESACEAFFENTTERDSTGKFVVQLPKKKLMLDRLGDSKSTALRRFTALERRLGADPVVKETYTNFIHEYLRLQHMREVPVDQEENTPGTPYYLPHHAVIKPESTTTKLRVVFDASCATTSGISLNDALMIGPIVQRDLYSIMLSFRLRRFAITADIEKMYRMVKMHANDHHLQRIVWRDNPSERIRTYELLTVTYGTSPAPYLATRCLKRVAEDSKLRYPAAAKTIVDNFYVDDLLKSVDSIGEGQRICAELIQLLGSAGFTLRKWSSNSHIIIDHIPQPLRDERRSAEIDSLEVKALGLKWMPLSDMFKFSVPVWSSSTEINKRIILSDCAKLFDPLGLVGPVIVRAKIFLQDLWKSKFSWNETITGELRSWWLEFRETLSGLTHINVPRWIGFSTETVSAEIHGFCEASEKAYGACLYLRCTSVDGNVEVSLITSKSRVAPIDDAAKKRKRISIPRLELTSALVCSHLFEKVIQAINLPIQSYFWTDSMITKCWLSSPPSRWNIFVANRVSEIQHITRSGVWNHISGAENPADVLSRGMTPDQLVSHQIWWQGPSWLRLEKEYWPRTVKIHVDGLDPTILEEKTTVSMAVQIMPPSSIFTLRSSLTDLVRIVALLLRFKFNCTHRHSRKFGFVTYQEKEDARHQLISLAQRESFEEDIEEIKRNGEVKSSSRIKSLTPRVIDGLLLVGGRLRNAQISVGRMHPIILSSSHPLTALIVTHYHRNLLHAGPQLVLSSLRERYWPLSARNLVRKIIHKCIQCYRTKPKPHEQLMGDLPVERVTPAPPFQRVGVDYCGPFHIQYPHRKGLPIKCFIAVFVCLVVKAINLEVVADLTTQAFIAALKRFVSRRGLPEIIMCDNATNFVGARRELDELRKQ
ncbi:uncharacterized protein LOC128740628 [Sabethes cyaneus]|uniref:uncharacterized protein LOC128740628 n=1 Tax=Sabethes cyaneus TaxID=53552 RepID=UPI00237D77CE|nr:uncharacterized protein LOC128740628 [Sabethes cyaneus]